MSTLEEYKRFLNQFKRHDKNLPQTHTSMANPVASFSVPPDRLDEFNQFIKKAYQNGLTMHLTEKPIDPSPLRIDLDFRFPLPVQGALTRLHTKEHIHTILKTYYHAISEYIDLTAQNAVAFVMEKPGPSEYRTKLKDGIHIIFPYLVVPDGFQHLIRRRVLEKADDMFKGLPLCNAYDDVIDEAIIDRNNWQMYGSCKPECDPYRVTHVITYSPKTKKPKDCPLPSDDTLPPEDLVELLSMRNKADEPTPFKADKESEVHDFTTKILPSLQKKKKDKIHERIFSTNRTLSNIKITASDEDFDLAKKLVMECLKPEIRGESYDKWINLGWCLRNIDHRLLETWIKFSRTSSKYVDGECERLWNSMRCDGLSMGTLRMWAKEDNREAYDKILENNVYELIDKSIASDGAHFDVARVVYMMYKDRYRYISRECWYVYDENRHRWLRTGDGLKLRHILSMDVVQKYTKRSLYWADKAITSEDEDVRSKCEEKKWKLLEIAKKLRMSGYKDGVIKECKCLFTDEKFEEKLDSAKHLIGFENGVYDLSLHEFRDGQPDDYISFTTGVHYVRYNPATEEAQGVEDFMSKVLTNPNVRRYVKDILAMSLDGSLKQERFYIFTGSGSNGKSALSALFQGSIGEYACILPISLLTQKRTASNAAQAELERTKGRRFALMQEPGQNEKLNIGLMKELTGGDKIMCRGLFKEPIEFRPQFKMILCCNDLPDVPSDDGGTWRRIRVIEFASKFTDSPDPNNPNEFRADIELGEKMEKWSETFVSMLIEHHKTLDPKNLYEPYEVIAATNSYRSNNDLIGQWMDVAFMACPGHRIRVNFNVFYKEFKEWAIFNGIDKKDVPDRTQIRTYIEKRLGKYPLTGYKDIRYFTPDELKQRAEEEQESEADSDAEAGPSS